MLAPAIASDEMTALEILNVLQPYQEYLRQLLKAEIEIESQSEWNHSVSLSYTFITLQIFRKTKESASKDIYLQIIFRIENDQIYLTEIYRVDGMNTLKILEEIKNNKELHGVSLKASLQHEIPFSDEVINYLSIADRISSHAVNMYNGDSYWPGNYSKVKLTANKIVLEQINHMNSRSLDHKDNYSLRDLRFQIPLQNEITFKQSYDDVLLGSMLISFSDRSSQNNRAAGNAIEEQIKKEYYKL